MSELIKLKNRIRAIETTEKVTKAMRLISMSLHTKLKHKATAIHKYDSELTDLFSSVQNSNKEWKSKILQPEKHGKTLIILIGSQKGLCGVFNSTLIKFFNKKIENYSNIDFIGLGKKASDFLSKKHVLKKQYSNLAPSKANEITNDLFNLITSAEPKYAKVVILYNYPKSFLIQVPSEKQIIPVPIQRASNQIDQEYVWEQPVEEVLEFLANEYLKFTLQATISDSLLAEQSARFKSMDSASRNAENLLGEMKKKFSKQRQAKITKELIELTGAF
jgi:F-type H+-transporting ATPase subunit gamma